MKAPRSTMSPCVPAMTESGKMDWGALKTEISNLQVGYFLGFNGGAKLRIMERGVDRRARHYVSEWTGILHLSHAPAQFSATIEAYKRSSRLA